MTNAHLVKGRGEALPFANSTFDVVTCILSSAYLTESYRVLRPGGWLLIETTGPRDQVNIKQVFGSDVHGPRGQYLALNAADFVCYFEQELGRLFINMTLRNGNWKTWYTIAALANLLENTSIVRDFERTKDAAQFARIWV